MCRTQREGLLKLILKNPESSCTISASAGIQSLVAGFPLQEVWQQVAEVAARLKLLPFAFSIVMNPVPVCSEKNKTPNPKVKQVIFQISFSLHDLLSVVIST